ncbi:putative phosphonate metabolism protein [Paracoccus thiocyanatus]|uniref:Putative phosphonate metabolism protein n=1 Tax=Paracoccus thiocyanatus TaxID=34006 RepID=A0A1N6U3E6_9RHOB|nr:DUF1045 domain-containing protein [Paracoccus thiocyanatus]SIQ60142.1 putative phosphonate metabolism protein [Paracoccus thiocyanatus]
MDMIKRYAVYYAPPEGDFASRASAWLGWDAAAGRPLTPPDLGLSAAEITRDPCKYGFHGTLKPPFRLAGGRDADELQRALAELAGRLAPVTLPGLHLASLGGFLALVPQGDTAPLQALAATVVAALDGLRAPLIQAEIARRRPEHLTPRQRELLDLWGYPYVMEEFRFHLTLTDRLEEPLATQAAQILEAHFAPVLPRPFQVADLCLFGEAEDGRFHLLHRYTLSG